MQILICIIKYGVIEAIEDTPNLFHHPWNYLIPKHHGNTFKALITYNMKLVLQLFGNFENDIL